jgi:ElaB/YqjD/DUF883 family membrane-anchored ribosome-binding protein
LLFGTRNGPSTRSHGTSSGAPCCSCEKTLIAEGTWKMAQNPNAEMKQDPKAIAAEAVTNLKAGASNLAERGAATVNDTLNTGREYVGHIRDAGQNLANSVYETGHRKAEEAAFYAELGYEEARDWVRGHPSQALGIAAGIGLLLGITVARR